jgi:hypothetical protein
MSHPSISQNPKIIHTPPTIAARKSPKKQMGTGNSFAGGGK